MTMVSLLCLSSSYQNTDVPHGRPQTVKIAALALSADGRQAAYAVHRLPSLPQEGTEDPAHSIYVAAVVTDAATVASQQSAPTDPSLLPFSKWNVSQTLSGAHTSPVTALAWSPATHQLVSASTDSCVFVWIPETAEGQQQQQSEEESVAAAPVVRVHNSVLFQRVPQLVMLSAEVALSPTSVAWSARGNKIYLGTAGGTVAVGRYDARQRWWICRILIPEPNSATAAAAVAAAATHEQPVLCIAPHPCDNATVAVALLSGSVRLLSTHLKSLDGAASRPVSSTTTSNLADAPTAATDTTAAAAAVEPFGYVYATLALPCWLHDLAWSPAGQQLAVVGHDSALHVWRWPSGLAGTVEHAVCRLRVLPLLQCAFATESVLVAGGFGGQLMCFAKGANDVWKMVVEGSAAVHAPAAAQAVLDAPALDSETGSSNRQRTVTASAAVDATANTTSVRQRALAFFAKRESEAVTPPARQASAAPAGSALPTQALQAPLKLLRRVPWSSSEQPSAPSPSVTTRQRCVSVNLDGQVQWWQLDWS